MSVRLITCTMYFSSEDRTMTGEAIWEVEVGDLWSQYELSPSRGDHTCTMYFSSLTRKPGSAAAAQAATTLPYIGINSRDSLKESTRSGRDPYVK